MAAKRERFSLLLLEPGEIYFEDYAVYHYPIGLPEHEAMQWKRKGRLKVCSKSLVFDPSDMAYPIIKFPLKDCTIIDQWKGSLMSKLDTRGAVVGVTCIQCIEMLPNGIIQPYNTVKKTEKYLFQLIYGNIGDCLEKINQLKRASSLSAGDQASMIAAIVNSRHSSIKFNPCWLQDLQEEIVFEKYGNRISPLVTNPGLIVLTTCLLYFQPFNNAEAFPVLKIKLEKITRIVNRRFLLRHVGIELFCSDDSVVPYLFFSLNSREDRNSFYKVLLSHPRLALLNTDQDNMLLRWQNRKISNYEYLLYLNSTADRSFNDLAQYPVFPWVIADYTSPELDLSNPDNFRDLKKPIGALNEERLKKYDEMSEPRFLYGSHYSTPGFILYYLVRRVPQLMLCLQSGRFDHPDRMFNSVADTWKNVTSNSTDFKEAIPEFYQPENKGDFLVNSLKIDFGVCQDGVKVSDVTLPPWARDPQDFVHKMRDALESEYVSLNLHHWIDLIFGYKQQGEEAEKADNVFYHLTYEGSVDLDDIQDINERYAMEVQIMEFGQVPKQIFLQPHPSRNSVAAQDNKDFPQYDGDNNPINPKLQESWGNISELDVTCAYQYHKETVRAVRFIENGKNLCSVSQDGVLKMYCVEDNKLHRSIPISNMALSSMKVMNDGKVVVIGSWDNHVYAYNFEFGKISSNLNAHDDAVSDIFLNENILATSSWDSTVKLWNYSPDMQFRRPYEHLLLCLDHDTRVTCLSMNASNSILLSGTDDGQLCLWDIESRCLIHQFSVDTGSIYSVEFSPDSQRFICGGHDLQMFDVKTKSRVFQDYPGEEIRCLQWDGINVLAGGTGGSIMHWDLTNPEVYKNRGHNGVISCIDVLKNGKMAATGGEDRRNVIWESKRREELN